MELREVCFGLLGEDEHSAVNFPPLVYYTCWRVSLPDLSCLFTQDMDTAAVDCQLNTKQW